MASIGFSPFVLDSFMVPTNISNNSSTSIHEETTCFSHIYDPCDYFLQDIPIHPHFHEKTTTPPIPDTIISTSTTTTHSHPNSSSSSMRLETSAETQAISKVVTGSMVKSREKKKKKKIIDISKVEKEGDKKGRKQKRKSDAMLKVITEERKLKAAAEDHHHHHHMKAKEKDNITPTTTTTNGYVHVRARRGEATDNHSLAERVRREKISERMRLLQSLVPGCDTIRGKTQVLDAIIIYVQTIQNQVEFVLAKHASVGVGPMFNEFEFDANPLVSEGNGVPSWEINELIRLELIVDILAAAATSIQSKEGHHIQKDGE